MPDNFTVDANIPIVAKIDEVLNALAKLQGQMNSFDSVTTKINTANNQMVQSFKYIHDEMGQVTATFTSVNGQMKNLSLASKNTHSDIVNLEGDFAKLATDAALAAAKVGEYARALQIANAIPLAAQRMPVVQQIQMQQAQMPIDRGNLIRNIRRGFEEELKISEPDLGRVYRKAESDLASFAAKNKVLWAQIKAEMQLQATGQFRLYAPGSIEAQVSTLVSAVRTAKTNILESNEAEARSAQQKAMAVEIANQREIASTLMAAQKKMAAQREAMAEQLRQATILQQAGAVAAIQTQLRMPIVGQPLAMQIPLSKQMGLEDAALKLAQFMVKHNLTMEEIIAEEKRFATESYRAFNQDTSPLRQQLQLLALAYRTALGDAQASMAGLQAAQAQLGKPQVDVKGQRLTTAQQAYANYQAQIAAGLLRQTDSTNRYTASLNQNVQTLTAVDKAGKEYTYTLTKVDGTLKEVTIDEKQMTAAARELTLTWQSMIRIFAIQMLHQAVYAFMNGIQQSVVAAKDLYINIALIQTISESGFKTDRWRDEILSLSNATGLVAEDVAKGVYDTLSNQIADGTRALQFMNEVSRFAIVTNSSLQDSVNAISSAINSYGMKAEDAGRISDVFFRMIDVGRIQAKDFANEIGRLYPLAAQLGISLEEVSGVLAVLTIKGVTPAQAMTSMYNIMSRMIKPAGEMKELLHGMGVETAQDALQFNNLAQMFAKIAEFSRGRPELLAQLFPDIRAMRAMADLGTSRGAEQAAVAINKMYDAIGATSKALEEFNNNPGKQFQITMNEIRNYFTQDWGTNIVKAVAEVSGSFVNLTDVMKVLTNFFLVTMVPAVLAGLARIALGTQAAQKGLLGLAVANPVIAAVMVIGTAIASFSRWRLDQEKELYKNMTDLNRKWSQDIQNQQRKTMNEINKYYTETTAGVYKYIAELNKALSGQAEEINQIAKQIMEELKDTQEQILQSIGKVVDGLKDQIKDLENDMKKLNEFILKAPEEEARNLFDIRMKNADDNLQKEKLLTDEIKRQEEARKKLTDADTRLEASKRLIDLYKQLDDVQRDDAKERKKDSEDVKKAIQERAKLEKDREQLLQKGTIQQMDQQKKINSLSKKQTITTVGGKIITPTLSARDLQAKKELQDSERRQKLDEIDRQIREKTAFINEKQRQTALGRFDIESKIRGIYKEDIKDAEELYKKNALEREARQKQVDEWELQIKKVKKAFSEIEKFDFSKITTEIDKDKFGKLTLGQTENINKLEQLWLKLTENNVELREKAEDQIASYREQIEAAIANKRKKEELDLLKDRLKKIDERFKKESEKLEIGKRAAQNIANSISNIPLVVPRDFDKLSEVFSQLYVPGRFEVRTNIDEMRGPINEMRTILEGFTKMNMTQLNDPAGRNLAVIKQQIAFIDDYKNTIIKTKGLTEDEKKQAIDSLQQIRNIFESFRVNMEDMRAANKITEQTIKDLKQEQDSIRKLIGEEFYATEALKDNTESQDKQTTALQELRSAVVDLTNRFPKAIIEQEKQLVEGVRTTRAMVNQASGGFIHGRDTIPALLSKGEFVVNAGATRRFYSQLVSMNRVQGYANGGLVTNVGDINLTMHSSGSVQSDIVAIGKGLQREIRRGRIRF